MCTYYMQKPSIEKKNITVATVKHQGGLATVRGCFATPGTGCIESLQSTIKFEDYQGILERNVLLSVRALGLSYGSGSSNQIRIQNTQEWLRTTHWTLL